MSPWVVMYTRRRWDPTERPWVRLRPQKRFNQQHAKDCRFLIPPSEQTNREYVCWNPGNLTAENGPRIKVRVEHDLFAEKTYAVVLQDPGITCSHCSYHSKLTDQDPEYIPDEHRIFHIITPPSRL